MDAKSWRVVLESIRPEDHTSVIVRTVDALEVAVESLARIEDEVVLVKGRQSGSPDGRRLFVFPYDKLSCLYVNRAVANDEIDLFSPSVSNEEKGRIAQRVCERVKLADDDAKNANSNRGQSEIGDVKSQLEELKRSAKLPASQAPTANEKPAGSGTQPAVKSGDKDDALAIPAPGDRRGGSRFMLPELPKRG